MVAVCHKCFGREVPLHDCPLKNCQSRYICGRCLATVSPSAGETFIRGNSLRHRRCKGEVDLVFGSSVLYHCLGCQRYVAPVSIHLAGTVMYHTGCRFYDNIVEAEEVVCARAARSLPSSPLTVERREMLSGFDPEAWRRKQTDPRVWNATAGLWERAALVTRFINWSYGTLLESPMVKYQKWFPCVICSCVDRYFVVEIDSEESLRVVERWVLDETIISLGGHGGIYAVPRGELEAVRVEKRPCLANRG